MPDPLKKFAKALPDIDFTGAEAEQIAGGASDRTYYRVTPSKGKSIIVMHYTDARPDNLKYTAAAATLASLKAPVPKILGENKRSKVVALQDLGNTHLWDHHDSPWKKRSTLYKAAIDAIKVVHKTKEEDLTKEQRDALEAPFDKALYSWEQDYYFEHFLGRYSRRAPSYVRSLRQEPVFAELSEYLDALPRTLVHRDFHSKNIIINRAKPYFIDFQGLRLGRPEYDIASLVYDPYVEFTDTERKELVKYAFKGRKEADWRPIFVRCAAQRLMQALGAYGKLAGDEDNDPYFQHVPNGLNNLREVLELEPILPRLNPYLAPEALKVEG
jgi:aminoglycoside/choline kinase family phosphotransferase